MQYKRKIFFLRSFAIWTLAILVGLTLWVITSNTYQSVNAAPVTTLQSQPVNVLLFTKTNGFRHDIIETGTEVIRQLGEEGGFNVTATEDASVFTDEGLANYKAIIFFNTSNDVLNEQQKVAFQKFIRGGGGFVGIHQGITTHQNWDWFLDMVGGGLKFGGHPEIQPGTLIVEDHNHPSTSHLPEEWTVTDEFYDFTVNPRSVTNVLMSLDESTYEGGGMGEDHPYAWYHMFEGGRVWCTGLGHTEEVVRSEDYHKHLIGGIRWAAGLEEVDSSGDHKKKR